MDLTNRMRGKQIAAVMTNGRTLLIRLEDGSEIKIAWVNDNGEPLQGRPFIESTGVRLKCEGMREIIHANSVGLRLNG
jgi:hypothetical protein